MLTARGETEYQFEGSPHVAMLEAFADSVERDVPPPITGRDGVAVSRVIAAAYESAAQGRAISIE